jgi:hypothetical protein
MRFLMRGQRWNAAKVHAERAGVKAHIHEKTHQWMGDDGQSIDGGDQHSQTFAGLQTLLTASEEKVR